jgi:hypothetical protein
MNKIIPISKKVQKKLRLTRYASLPQVIVGRYRKESERLLVRYRDWAPNHLATATANYLRCVCAVNHHRKTQAHAVGARVGVLAAPRSCPEL